jgi:hypothetical protein
VEFYHSLLIADHSAAVGYFLALNMVDQGGLANSNELLYLAWSEPTA